MLQVQREKEGPFDLQLGQARHWLVAHGVLGLLALGTLAWFGLMEAASVVGIWLVISGLLIGGLWSGRLREGRILAACFAVFSLAGVPFLLWGLPPAADPSVSQGQFGGVRLVVGGLNVAYAWLALRLWRSGAFRRVARYGLRQRL